MNMLKNIQLFLNYYSFTIDCFFQCFLSYRLHWATIWPLPPVSSLMSRIKRAETTVTPGVLCAWQELRHSISSKILCNWIYVMLWTSYTVKKIPIISTEIQIVPCLLIRWLNWIHTEYRKNYLYWLPLKLCIKLAKTHFSVMIVILNNQELMKDSVPSKRI